MYFFFLEKARTDLSPACSVKVRHLEQARTDLCPACVIFCSFRTKMDRREPARSHLRLPCSVKVGCVVVLFRGTVVSASKKSKSLNQARSDPYPACSVKLHSVIVLTNRTTFIPWHEGSDSRIEV